MELYGQVAARRPKYAAKPGVGLATCGLSITVLSMLGYAVATSRPAVSPPTSPPPAGSVETAQASDSQRSAALPALEPLSADVAETRSLQVGQLDWPPATEEVSREPTAQPLLSGPVYEPPYGARREAVVRAMPDCDPQSLASVATTPDPMEVHAAGSSLPPLADEGQEACDDPQVEVEWAAVGTMDQEQLAATPSKDALVGNLSADNRASENLAPGFPAISAPATDVASPNESVRDSVPSLALSPPAVENPYFILDPPEPETSSKPEPQATDPKTVASAPVGSTDGPGSAIGAESAIGESFAAGGSLFGPPPSAEATALGPSALPAPAAALEVDEDLLAFEDVEAQLASAAPLDDLLIDTPAPGEVARLMTTDVQQAFALGRHGALHAARARFIGVMRKVALAKDAQQSTDAHATALAAGLRALEEAEDFVPRGGALDADLDVRTQAASHATPLYHSAAAGDATPRWTPPHEAIARYHRYAQHKLARAVGQNQAGSMALHGLGKTYARLAEIEEKPLAKRSSLTMYRAAVEAHRGNYLAANELGVGLAKAGRYQAARQALEQAVAGGAKSTVYRNLAVVQEKLGQNQLAMAARVRADQLASAEMAAGAFSRERGVAWVRPKEFVRVAEASGPGGGTRVARNEPRPSVARQLAPSQAVGQRPAVWGQPMRGGVAPQQIPRNRTAQPVRSQTIVR